MFEQQSSSKFYLVITSNYKPIPTYSHSKIHILNSRILKFIFFALLCEKIVFALICEVDFMEVFYEFIQQFCFRCYRKVKNEELL